MRSIRHGLAAFGICATSISIASAAGIDDLKGSYAFNWRIDPATVACEEIGDELLAELKSARFTCELTPVTNTSSGAPARVCTEAGEGREYLIFSTKAECEEERTTQASNE